MLLRVAVILTSRSKVKMVYEVEYMGKKVKIIKIKEVKVS